MAWRRAANHLGPTGILQQGLDALWGEHVHQRGALGDLHCHATRPRSVSRPPAAGGKMPPSQERCPTFAGQIVKHALHGLGRQRALRAGAGGGGRAFSTGCTWQHGRGGHRGRGSRLREARTRPAPHATRDHRDTHTNAMLGTVCKGERAWAVGGGGGREGVLHTPRRCAAQQLPRDARVRR